MKEWFLTLQPLPQVWQQDIKSAEETLYWLVWPEAMQTLSLMASAAPKAQQEPQADWSLISLIDWHFGHLSLESKLSGAFLMSSSEYKILGISSGGKENLSPFSFFIMLKEMSVNCCGISALQEVFWALISSAICLSLSEYFWGLSMEFMTAKAAHKVVRVTKIPYFILIY